MIYMTNVECEHCLMDSHFPEDSPEYAPCAWCGQEIETGWSDCYDEDDDE